MALYKNDQPHKLTAKDLERVYKFMGWDKDKGTKNRPAVIKFVDNLYKFDRNNKRQIRPPRVNIPLEETTFVENEGTVKWNYTETPPRTNKEGVVEYAKSHRPMTGPFSVDITRVDFLFFLLLSKFRESSPGDSSDRIVAKKPLFKIEFKEREAAAKLSIHSRKIEAQAFINGPIQIRWSEEKVKTFAIAFGIEEAFEMGDAEVRATLLGRLEGEKDGYKKFFDLMDNDEYADSMSLVSRAKSLGLITYFKPDNTWRYVINEKAEDIICKGLKSGRSKEQALADYLMSDLRHYTQLKEMVAAAE